MADQYQFSKTNPVGSQVSQALVDQLYYFILLFVLFLVIYLLFILF